MANIRLSVAARNAMLSAVLDRINLGSGPGTLKLYSGTQPANGDAALSGNTLIATLQFSDPAAGSPANGSILFSTIGEVTAVATGNVSWARIQDSDGNNVFDGDVKADGTGFINFNRVDFPFGAPVRINTFLLTIPETFVF